MKFLNRVGLALVLAVIMVSIFGGPEWLDSQTAGWLGLGMFIGLPNKKLE